MKNSLKMVLFAGITGITLIGIFWLPPIAQPAAFHHFADARSLWGIHNFGNVSGNLAFGITGLLGLHTVSRAVVPVSIRLTYLILFTGVLFTGLGSAYYHWDPNNDTLVWDRIPMTIVFMSFLSATLSEFVSGRLGSLLLLPLVTIGVGSVIWWHYTEMLGRGDLRLYYWVQYYPMLAIVLLIWLYYVPEMKPMLWTLVWIVVWYTVAKVFEFLDYPIYNAFRVSGHSLKHLAAAVSTGYFVVLFRKKYLVSSQESVY